MNVSILNALMRYFSHVFDRIDKLIDRKHYIFQFFALEVLKVKIDKWKSKCHHYCSAGSQFLLKNSVSHDIKETSKITYQCVGVVKMVSELAKFR